MERLIQHFRRRSSTSSRSAKWNLPAPRRLIVTSHTIDFDPVILRHFETEGFNVSYLPFPTETDDVERDRKDLETLIHELEDDLEPRERYAIVAYNRPAYLLLLSHHQLRVTTNPFPRLCAFVAFYPQLRVHVHAQAQAQASTAVQTQSQGGLPSSTTASWSPSLSPDETVTLFPIQIHLAGQYQDRGTEQQQQGQDRCDVGNRRHRCRVFYYPESWPGFAEPTSSAEYDRISARLAWTRALGCLRKGFGMGGSTGTEALWEGYWKNLYRPDAYTDMRDHAEDMMNMMVGGGAGDPDSGDKTSVNCVPSGVGGCSPSEIATFYSSQFVPSGPPSQNIRLLSRTAGPDRVVDELLLTFDHTEEIPWLLPGVPPTGRSVRVPLIMTASFCAGKIARHKIYWDQASVLVQVGLLDPSVVPLGFKATGPNREGKDFVQRLPVVGEEAVDAVLS